MRKYLCTIRTSVTAGAPSFLLKVISGKTVIIILEQRLSQCYLTAELELHNIVAYTEITT